MLPLICCWTWFCMRTRTAVKNIYRNNLDLTFSLFFVLFFCYAFKNNLVAFFSFHFFSFAGIFYAWFCEPTLKTK